MPDPAAVSTAIIQVPVTSTRVSDCAAAGDAPAALRVAVHVAWFPPPRSAEPFITSPSNVPFIVIAVGPFCVGTVNQIVTALSF